MKQKHDIYLAYTSLVPKNVVSEMEKFVVLTWSKPFETKLIVSAAEYKSDRLDQI